MSENPYGSTSAAYTLYANSFGSDTIYYAGSKTTPKGVKYQEIADTLTRLDSEIGAGTINYISEEFRAKALSAYIQASAETQRKYKDQYRLLGVLPVARTEDQIAQFIKDRDAAVARNQRFFEGRDRIKIREIKADAETNKFEDRSAYTEMAVSLVFGREKSKDLVAKLDKAIQEKKRDTAEFNELISELSTAYTAEFVSLPEEIVNYPRAYDNVVKKKAQTVVTATTATDTPSVPDAEVVPPAAESPGSDPPSSEEEEAVPPEMTTSMVEQAMTKSKDVGGRAKTIILSKKAEGIITATTALDDSDKGILQINGKYAESVKHVWVLVKQIIKDEVPISSVFKDKLTEYYNSLQYEGKRKHKEDYDALMAIEPNDDHYDALATNARAAFYEGRVDPRVQLDEVLEESMIGEGSETSEAAEEAFSEPEEPPVFDDPPEEEPPVIEALETDEERRRELEAANRDLIDELTAEQRARLFTAPVRVLENWVAARRYAIAADVQGNVDHDEADNGADDGFFGLRNNYINAILLSQQYTFQDFIRIRDLLKGQPAAVYDAALQRIRSRPNQSIAFDQQFLNEVLQQQNDAGNIVEGAAPEAGGAPAAQVDDEAYAGLGALFYEYPRPPDPEQVVEPKPSVSGSQPITGTGSDSEKLQYRPRVHPDVLEIFFGQSSYPDWDPDLEKKLMSMEMPEARRIEIMDEVIAEYGTKIFIKARKGSSKEELNELVQLQFCVMRNLQRGPRAKTASIKVADLVRMQSLAAGSGTPAVPGSAVPGSAVPGSAVLGPEAQQVANIQAAPKPMITSPGDTITNAQVQTFSESKFISDYSKMQMDKNLNSGVKLEYPNPAPRIYNNETPQTVNHPEHAAGLGRRKVSVFSSGKF